MRYIGIDLAWGENNRTGLAELDPAGRLVSSASVTSDDEIAAFLGGQGLGLVAAIDAPLIVPNETGQRPCEREVGRLFGPFHAGAYPANRGNPAFFPEPRGARLARRFGWDLDPTVRPHPDAAVAIEVYPHPAMVSLFALSRVIAYKGKKGRDVSSRQAAFRELFAHMDATCGSLLHLESSARWRHLRGQVEEAPRQVDLNTAEDEVDAIFCAYLAWLWANDANALAVVGDVTHGYIVTPLPPNAVAPERIYSIDADEGKVRFGDGVHGIDAPSGIQSGAAYRAGGGAAGDVRWQGRGLTRYLISFDDGAMTFPEAEIPAVGDAAHAVVRAAQEAGVWIFGGGVESQRASIVTTDGTVVDGSYPETKAVVGGFAIIEVPSREAALQWAARFAVACRCSQEVREIMFDPLA